MPRNITALAIALYEAYKDDPIPYWYGCYGQMPTQALADKKAKQYPQYWTKEKLGNPKSRVPMAQALNATFCCDCIGWLRVLCLYDAKVNPVGWPKSNTNGYVVKGKNYYSAAGMDVSANGIRKAYGGKSMTSLPEPTASKAVFVSMEGHVGLYIGKGEVIEQTPPKLQKTKLAGRNWTSWGYIPDKWRDFMEKTVGLGAAMDCSVKGGSRNITAAASKPLSSSALKASNVTYMKHTVVRGDTPWSVAKKFSGNGLNYTKLVWLTKSDGGKKGSYKTGVPIPFKKGSSIFIDEVLGYPV
jgi:hypothetical protein